VSGEAALSQVLHAQNTAECLREVMRTGTAEGKMYALVALRELDPAEFRIQIKKLGQQQFEVIVLATKESGVMEKQPSKTILNRIRQGAYRRDFQFLREHLISD
jgi:hypothetical protein